MKSTLPPLWWIDAVEIENGACLSFQLGEIQKYGCRTVLEWRFADFLDGPDYTEIPAVSPLRKAPEHLSWQRFVVEKASSLKIAPVMPDLPVISKPAEPVTLLPNQEVKFYAAIPLWGRFISCSGKREHILFEFPLRTLSKTWNGDPTSGYLAYSTSPVLRPSAEENGNAATSVWCPLMLKNDTKMNYTLDKIIIHAENLGVYRCGSLFFSNPVTLVCYGENQGVKTVISEKTPKEMDTCTLITSPREKINRNLWGKSVKAIREIASIG